MIALLPSLLECPQGVPSDLQSCFPSWLTHALNALPSVVLNMGAPQQHLLLHKHSFNLLLSCSGLYQSLPSINILGLPVSEYQMKLQRWLEGISSSSSSERGCAASAAASTLGAAVRQSPGQYVTNFLTQSSWNLEMFLWYTLAAVAGRLHDKTGGVALGCGSTEVDADHGKWVQGDLAGVGGSLADICSSLNLLTSAMVGHYLHQECKGRHLHVPHDDKSASTAPSSSDSSSNDSSNSGSSSNGRSNSGISKSNSGSSNGSSNSSSNSSNNSSSNSSNNGSSNSSGGRLRQAGLPQQKMDEGVGSTQQQQ